VARASVHLRLETRPSPEVPVDEDLRGQGERVYPIPKRAAAPLDRDAVFTRLVISVAGDLIDGWAARGKLRDAPPAAVQAAIRADGGELREEAMRIAGERKLRDAVPALIDLLEDPSEPVRD